MVHWRSETIVQWIDRFEASLAELEVAQDGLNPYEEDELIYWWKQTFSDNISGEEILRTPALYCYSSTAVQLAVQFCCCLC